MPPSFPPDYITGSIATGSYIGETPLLPMIDHRDIDAAFAEFPKAHRCRFRRSYLECDLRITAGYTADDGLDEPTRKVLWASDPHLAGSGICKKFDVADALLQFIRDDLLAP